MADDLKLRHSSGAFKFMPGFPDCNDLCYIMHIAKKKSFSREELLKMTGVEDFKLNDPLSILMEAGLVEKREEKFVYVNEGDIKYIKANEPEE